MIFGCICGNGLVKYAYVPTKVVNVTKGIQNVDIAIHVYIDKLLDGVLN